MLDMLSFDVKLILRVSSPLRVLINVGSLAMIIVSQF